MKAYSLCYFCGKRCFCVAQVAEKALRGFLESDVTTSRWWGKKHHPKTTVVDVTGHVTRHAPYRSRVRDTSFLRMIKVWT